MTRARGAPRVQYARTFVLLPNDCTAEEINAYIAALLAAGYVEKRWTIGFSADDAGIGDLDVRRIIAIDPQRWSDDLREFFAREYPGTEYLAVVSGGRGLAVTLRTIG